MVERLRAYRVEVEDYQRGLQRKVEERTRQLEASTREARELAASVARHALTLLAGGNVERRPYQARSVIASCRACWRSSGGRWRRPPPRWP